MQNRTTQQFTDLVTPGRVAAVVAVERQHPETRSGVGQQSYTQIHCLALRMTVPVASIEAETVQRRLTSQQCVAVRLYQSLADTTR